MRVCIVTATAGRSGVETVVLNLAESLLLRPGWHVEVITFAPGHLVERLALLGIKTRILLVKGKFDLLKIYHLWQLLRGRYDIIHSHGSRACFFSNIASTFDSASRIVTIHQSWDVRAGHWLNRIANFAERIAISWLTDCRIYVSKALHDEIEPQCFANGGRSIVIHNSVAKPFLNIEPRIAAEMRARKRDALGISDDTIVIGCVARLDTVKGQRFLIDAVAQLQSLDRNLLLILVGGGEDKGTLMDLVAMRRIVGKVLFAGAVDDCTAWYPCFDVLVVPSLSESFGLSAIEGTCYGLPVVASDCPGLIEALDGRSDVFIVKKGSAEEIARGIKAAISRKGATRSELDSKKREDFSYFSSERLGNDHIAVYQTLTNASTRYASQRIE